MHRDPWRSPLPPFSFQYEGSPAGERIHRWTDGEPREGDRTVLVANDEATGLTVEASVRRFADVDGVEWLLNFVNNGDTDTPIIEDILPLDWVLKLAESESLVVHSANGSRCAIDDFVPKNTKLRVGGEITLAPYGGRSSDGVLPFFSLDWGHGGVVIAVGWTGQWRAVIKRDATGVRITAGTQRTHLRLHPGERIRSPRILVLRWDGSDPDAGNNLLRRTILKHYSPRIDDEPALPPIAHMRQLVFYLTGKVSEADHLRAVDRAKELGLEAMWVDACWYGSTENWSENVGDWRIFRERFPNGLRPVADAAHDAGMKFILWFEPERVRRGTPLQTEHPEWLLDNDVDDWNYLFDLGNDEARRYLTEFISGMIDEVGIDIYRQDFNFEPLTYWNLADEPDRVGMHEIRHIEGLYAFWDELRARHPRLLIDNCSSGGRRIDLETTSRSFPLWRSDYTDLPAKNEGMRLQIGAQAQTAGLSRWVPIHAASVWTFEPYDMRSSFSTGVALYTDILADDYPIELVKQAVAEVKRLRPYLLGDFYPLVPLTVEDHDWCAYQFDRPDLGTGCAIFLRRHESPYPSMAAGLRNIDMDARYEISLSRMYERGQFHQIGTWDLKRLTVSIPTAPGSLLLEYRKRTG